jgi:hypothetical protein
MHFYPASLLITAAILLPNLLYLAFPPVNLKRYGSPKDSRVLEIVERIGQGSSFLLPVLFRPMFSGTIVILAWTLMGISLAFYYACWIRFFANGRDYALLFARWAGIPVPMAISPVAAFLLSSIVLGSFWQAFAAVILGLGHITITAHEHLRIRRATESSHQGDPET